MTHLVLFDIDGTLVRSPAGPAAFTAAGRDVFGDAFSLDGVVLSGWLDPLILDEALRLSGLPVDDDDNKALFWERYPSRIRAHLDEQPDDVRLLQGALDAVQAAVEQNHVHLGLVTGNHEPVGWTKLAHVDIDATPFVYNGFGNEARERHALVTLARSRASTALEREVQHVLVVGDTPRDVEAAHAVGAECLAVSTGRYDADALRDAGADHVVDGLDDVAFLLEWMQR